MPTLPPGLPAALQALDHALDAPAPPRHPAGQLALAGPAADGRRPRRPGRRGRRLRRRLAGGPRRLARSASATRCCPGSAASAARSSRPLTSRRPGSSSSGWSSTSSGTCSASTTWPTTRSSWSSAAPSRSGSASPRLCPVPSVRRRARRGAGVADRNRLESGRWQRCQPRVRIPPPLLSCCSLPREPAPGARRPPGRRRPARSSPPARCRRASAMTGISIFIDSRRITTSPTVDLVARLDGHAQHVGHHLRDDLGHRVRGPCVEPSPSEQSGRARRFRPDRAGLLEPAAALPAGAGEGQVDADHDVADAPGRRPARSSTDSPHSSSEIAGLTSALATGRGGGHPERAQPPALPAAGAHVAAPGQGRDAEHGLDRPRERPEVVAAPADAVEQAVDQVLRAVPAQHLGVQQGDREQHAPDRDGDQAPAAEAVQAGAEPVDDGEGADQRQARR